MTDSSSGAAGRQEAEHGLVDGIITSRDHRARLSEARRGREVIAVARPAGLGVKVRSVGGGNEARRVTWQRGEVRGFSRASRRRMLCKLSFLDWAARPCYFITLTYHNEWGEWPEWKSDLDAFCKRFERRWGKRGMVWREELQMRLAPHFHLAVFFDEAPNLTELRRWVSKNWNDIAAPGDAQHLRAGTNVKRARNTSGPGVSKLMQYLGKYLAKQQRPINPETGEIEATGRIWGMRNEEALPWGEWQGYTMPYEAYVALTRRIRRWGESSHYLSRVTAQWQGFLVLGDGVNLVARLMRGLDYTETG